MIRILGAVGLILGLAGCATTDDGAWWRAWTAAAPAAGRYHFDWRLSGDADLAPLQVFDDGHDTWLQYPADQAAPAVFSRTAAGDRLLRVRRSGDYLVLRGVPEHLLMRGGLSQAEARRMTGDAPDASTGGAAEQDLLDTVVPVVAQSLALPVAPSSPDLAQAPSVKSPPSVPAPAPVPVPVTRPFDVTPADGNLRRALTRWAALAGWTFQAEHWAVDVDIPLAGSAVFDDTFRSAVCSLLAATELGDRPVQPCFYANQVLRVVPLAQRCDRTQLPGGES